MSLMSQKQPLTDYYKVQVLHKEVYSLLKELPPALRPQSPDKSWDLLRPHLPAVRQRVATTGYTFLLALHRTYVATHVASRHAAIEAAISLLQTQQCLFDLINEPQYKLYGYSFYTLDAGMFLAAMVMEQLPEDFGLLERVQNELQHAIHRLALMKERNAIAKAGEHILRQCYQNMQSSSLIALNWASRVDSQEIPSMSGLQPQIATVLQDIGFRTSQASANQMVSQLLDINDMPTNLVDQTSMTHELFGAPEHDLTSVGAATTSQCDYTGPSQFATTDPSQYGFTEPFQFAYTDPSNSHTYQWPL